MRRTAVLGTLAAALLLALVTWAAAIGPDRVLTDRGAAPEELGFAEPTTEPSEPGTAEAAEDRPLVDEAPATTPGWVRLVALLLQLGCAVALVYVVLALARRWLRRRVHRRRRTAPSEPEFEVLPGAATAEAIERDAGAQRAALEGGTPRNAIVACWHRFETQAHDAGLRRRPHETTGEFVLGVLEEIGADRGAVGRLADLYREARFSDHPLGEDDRRRALEALDEVHASLRVLR